MTNSLTISKQTISIRLDPTVWKNARIEAAKKDMKLGQFVEEAIKDKLKK